MKTKNLFRSSRRSYATLMHVVQNDTIRFHIACMTIITMLIMYMHPVYDLFTKEIPIASFTSTIPLTQIMHVKDEIVDNRCIPVNIMSESITKEETTVLEEPITKIKEVEAIENSTGINDINNIDATVRTMEVIDAHKLITVIETEPDYVHEMYETTSSVKNPSGLTADQIDILLKDTKLYGIGDSVYQIEQQYGIDAYYTISVAVLESGHGRSNLATTKNNIFGLMLERNFESFDDCVRYFGRLMNKYENIYNVTMTTDGINTLYCTLNSWSGKIVELMNQYTIRANEMF